MFPKNILFLTLLLLPVLSLEPHKSIFPITFWEVIGYLSLFVVTIITTVGGIGGGAFYLPIFMVFFSFTLKEAIPLSITCVMGILLARFLNSIGEKHPRRDKPLINYEVCLIFSPSITVGTVFGVLVNKIAPSWLILLLVLFVLGELGYKTFRKARALREAEKVLKGRKLFNLTEQEKTYLLDVYAKIRDLDEDNIDFAPERKTSRVAHSTYVRQMSMNYIEKRKKSAGVLPYEDFKDNQLEMKLLKKDDDDDSEFLAMIQDKIKNIECFEKIYHGDAKTDPQQKQDDPESKSEILDDDVIPPDHIDTSRKSVLQRVATNLQRIIEAESRSIPKKKLYLILMMLGILILITLLQVPSFIGVSYCSTFYWIIRFSFLPIGFIFLLYVIRLLTQEHKEKKECGYIFLKNDLTYDMATSLRITKNGVFTGFASSVLGIGGAIFIGPLLLQLGLSPHESTYTASFSALLTSFSAFIQYLLTGLIKWDYAFVLTIIGIVAMYIGMEVVLKYVKRMGNSSIIVEVLAFVIILSTVLIIVSGVSFMVIDYENGIDVWSFRPIC